MNKNLLKKILNIIKDLVSNTNKHIKFYLELTLI